MRHIREEAFKPARCEDEQMTAGLGPYDPKRMLSASGNEHGLASALDEGLALKPELAFAAQDYERLILALVHMPRRAASGWAKAVHDG
jgi:hypothetical protein